MKKVRYSTTSNPEAWPECKSISTKGLSLDDIIKELTKDGDIIIEFVVDELKPAREQPEKPGNSTKHQT